MSKTKTIATKIGTRTASTPLPDGVSELSVRDTELTGFRLRITPRARRFVFAGRVKGGGRRTVILGDADSMTAAQARTAAMDVRSRFLTGDDFVAEAQAKASAITFDEAANQYETLWSAGKLRRQKRTPRPETVRDHAKNMKRARAEFGATPVTLIDIDAVRTFAARLEVEDVSADVKRKAFGAPRKVLDHVLSAGLINLNPMKAMEGFTAGEARDRYLSENEVAQAWAATEAMGTHMDFCRFMMAQPVRLSLGLDLDWSDVELDAAVIRVAADAEGNKSRREWRLPLSPIAHDILRGLYECQASGHVFQQPNGKPLGWQSYHMSKWRTVSGVDGWSIHDLRRTATTLSGERFESYEESLGDLWLMHLRTGVHGTYQRASRVEALRTPARQWSQLLAEITDQATVSNVVAL